MASLISTLKAAIKGNLDTLKQAGTLGTVVVDDFKTDPLGIDKNIGEYPAAILGPASVESAYETNRDNLRTHTFEILVIEKGENVSRDGVIEDLMQSILDIFDNDPTLGGLAVGAVEPATSSPTMVPTEDGSFIIFSVSLRVRGLVTLTF